MSKKEQVFFLLRPVIKTKPKAAVLSDNQKSKSKILFIYVFLKHG